MRHFIKLFIIKKKEEKKYILPDLEINLESKDQKLLEEEFSTFVSNNLTPFVLHL